MSFLRTILGDPATAAVVQIAVLAVLAWTMKVLIGYAKDTAILARTAEEQRDLTLRPCVVIEKFEGRDPMRIAMDRAIHELAQKGQNPFPAIPAAEPSGAELGSEQRLLNVGIGPAIAVQVFKIDTDGTETYKVLYPQLQVSQGVNLGLGVGFEHDEVWKLEIRYDGASGARFFSRYTLEGKVVRNFESGQLPRKQITP